MMLPLFCPQPNLEENKVLYDKLRKASNVVPVESLTGSAVLIIVDGRVGIANEDWPKVSPVFVDFVTGALNHRRLHGGGVGQAIAKSVGLNKRRDLKVVDGTAGLGRDAFVLASLGASVCMFERNPSVQFVLQDGLERLAESVDEDLQAIYQRLTLYAQPIQSSWQAVEAFAPDVIYLDPMFPERTKSAKVKKDMALFHHVVGADDDADELLTAAMDLAEFRVVVKRPRHAPHLSSLRPTTMQVGKSSRFDIYSKKAIR